MAEGIRDKTVVTVTVERRLEVDGSDIMQKIIVRQEIDATDNELVIDNIRELLKQAEQNPFTFL